MSSFNNIESILKLPIQKGTQVFIAPNATVIGRVRLDNKVSVWFGAVLRGDAEWIHIREGANIQDNVVVHADPGFPCSVGPHCSIGHGAIVHGATLEEHVLVGMNATIMNGAHIGAFSIIGAGAVVPEGMVIPERSLVLGIPAKVVKSIGPDFEQKIRRNASAYIELSESYLKAGI